MRKREKEIQRELQKLINKEETVLPEKLDSGKIKNLLVGTEQKTHKKNYGKKIISFAAAAAVLAVLVTAGIRLPDRTAPVEKIEQQSVQPAESFGSAPLKSAEDYKEIENYFLEVQKKYKQQQIKDRLHNVFSFGAGKQDMKTESPPIAGESNGSTASSGSLSDEGAKDYGSTNLQVGNVDEADIVKNDGEYLYIADALNKKSVRIVKALPAESMQAVSRIELSGFDEAYTIEDIYLYKNLLVVMAQIHDTDKAYADREILCGVYDAGNSQTVAVVFDISDRAAPREVKRFGVDGARITSRITEGRLLIAAEYAVPVYEDETALKARCVPQFYLDGEAALLPSAQIIITQNEESGKTYLVVGSLALEDLAASPQMTAVLGGGSNCYCTDSALFFAKTVYAAGEEKANAATGTTSYTPGAQTTQIFMFDIAGGKLAYKAFGTVEGETDDQFSMDLHNGYFRVATTVNFAETKVTVLDKDLKTVGEIGGLAKGERIYAVRFRGDTAYIVTFKQTDPLFVIDLSDPANPELKGELKIPGFSDYLHPYSDTLLIGVGRDGTQSGANNNIKISLFDVSDPNNPQEISKAIYKGGYVRCIVQNEHKAFLSVRNTGEFAVPIFKERFEDNQNKLESYLTMLRVTPEKTLEITAAYGGAITDYAQEVLRGTYIGNTIYTVSGSAVRAFDKASGEETGALHFSNSGGANGDSVYN